MAPRSRAGAEIAALSPAAFATVGDFYRSQNRLESLLVIFCRGATIKSGAIVFISVVIPTYNRRAILEKCLVALEQQHLSPDTPISGYEVVVVDDGSTDGTLEWLAQQRGVFPHVRCLQQDHQGPAAARNLGVTAAIGETIIFIDSDLVVTASFLQAHAEALVQGQQTLGRDRLFTYGRVINTCNFEHPTSEPYKITDFSAAYFATGNVAIARHWLEAAGLFDTQFHLYGWEDLELGVRLKHLGLKLVKCPEAVGYHWHPAFHLEQIPRMIDREIQRGSDGGAVLSKASYLGSTNDDSDDLDSPPTLGAAVPGRASE
ncbi:glycosyltransferase family 2 protein [Neosynechococcus sphagnicola]|uniref:glycosyltransferase family 2 protein n=1 Tax=Neosynechococcus sphagnicola TaxID=1501145 RepID=UPI000A8C978C